MANKYMGKMISLVITKMQSYHEIVSYSSENEYNH